jgi:hypothetical protein
MALCRCSLPLSATSARGLAPDSHVGSLIYVGFVDRLHVPSLAECRMLLMPGHRCGEVVKSSNL